MTFCQQISISFSLRILPDEDITGRNSVIFVVDLGSVFLEIQAQVLIWWLIPALSMENLLWTSGFSSDLNEIKVKQQKQHFR